MGIRVLPTCQASTINAIRPSYGTLLTRILALDPNPQQAIASCPSNNNAEPHEAIMQQLT